MIKLTAKLKGKIELSKLIFEFLSTLSKTTRLSYC